MSHFLKLFFYFEVIVDSQKKYRESMYDMHIFNDSNV